MTSDQLDTAGPGYTALFHSGELKRRTDVLVAQLESCDICPRECGVNRLAGKKGFCATSRLAMVSSACAHHGEEPAISGSDGSGTIFFNGCNMRCVYCQNYQISQQPQPRSLEVTPEILARHMLSLQNSGCHNINLVSPSHVVPQIAEALLVAIPQGLHIPLVYNTSGYDSIATLKLLDGIIDIYLTDLRYASGEKARDYSQTADYPAIARAAIKEMYRQVGDLRVDSDGIARRGLIVRHLILPENIAGSEKSLTWLAKELSPTVAVSLMSQYYPAHLAAVVPALSRKITQEEYDSVLDIMDKLGLENGWIQEMSSAENYLPDFESESPFNG